LKRLAAAATLGLAAVLAGALAAGAALGAVSSRAPVTLYKLPRVPPTGGAGPLAVDQKGEVWFDETYEVPPEEPGESPRFPGQIVRMNRQGILTVAQRVRPSGLAVAPDGSVWFTGFYKIGRIAPDGTLSVFPLPDGENEEGKFVFEDGPLVVGADGNVWFSGARGLRQEDGSAAGNEPIIGRLTPAGDLTEFDLPPEGGHPIRLANGPDGNVWFTEPIAHRVARITPTGQIEGFPLSASAQPTGIAAGPDGALWFLEGREKDSAIARMSTSGALTEFPLELSELEKKEEIGGLFGAGSVVAGPDGRIWFAYQAGSVGRIGPNGRLSNVPIPTRSPEAMAVGPEGSIWYTSAAEPPCLAGDSVCGQGGYYQSGVIGRIDPAPLSVQLEGGKLAAHAHRVKVRIACLDGIAGQSCRGRLRLRSGGKALAERRYALGTDLSRGVSLRLSKGARTRLLRRGSLRARCIATLPGGRAEVRVLRLRLRTPPAA
jgi:virginiamycin B lyase